jgi:uncharacterized protein involved in outer membrane biogenesis
MPVPKFVRWIAYVVGGLIAIILVVVVVLSLVQIPIDLTKQKGAIEAVASRSLGRSLKIDGKVQVTTSLWPAFKIEGVRLGNPKGFETGDFAQMKFAKIQVAVLPLLLTKIHIQEFSVKGLAVTLLENKEGAVNWSSQVAKDSTPEPQKQKRPEAEEGEPKLASDSLVVRKLTLKDITVTYRDRSMAKPYQFTIEECSGAALPRKPFTLSMKGKLLKEVFSTTVKAGSLEQLIRENRSWMEIQTEIAKTHFQVKGDIDLSQALRTLKVKSSVRGERLDSLNGLLKVDLPPLKNYGAGGLLLLQKGRIDLSDFEIYVGKSKLVGKMTIDNTGSLPVTAIDLDAPMIQLNDFDLGDWSPENGDSKTPTQQEAKSKESVSEVAKEEKKAPSVKAGEADQLANVFSPEVLGSFEAQMKVQVEKALSGADELGSGSLTATLKQGRISIDPVKLNIPGGSFFFATSVKPGREASEASVRATMENFDFGVLARRADPQTDMGGSLNLNVDLKSSARSFDELLANGNGYLDFSARPENLRAGIIDLWAVNVIAAIASKDEKDASKINCLIGRWSMKDGMLKPDVFVIDTSKIRICGKGQVDFKKEQISLKVAPTAKKPEFFSLATPLEVKGQFSDFGLGIQAGGLFGTAITFVTSPLHVPLRMLAGEGLPEDGGDVCSMSIGPEDRSTKPPKGCR